MEERTVVVSATRVPFLLQRTRPKSSGLLHDSDAVRS